MRTTWRRPIVAAVASIALAVPIVATAVSAEAAVLPTVVINEVESDGDATDWIELTNTGTAAVDVSGWLLKDNDDTHTVAIAAGTTIQPGAYQVVDVDDKATAGNFGLGKADAARVFTADGTLVDSYTWTAHAGVTYGRFPNGTGAFAQTAVSSKGAANTPVVPSVKINEVESNGGTPGDWIEIVNTGTSPVDVSGWILKDNDATHALPIAAGTTLAAGAYLAVDVDDKAVAGNFGLGGADSAMLYLPDSTTLVDSYTWTAHAGVTYGRYPNGTGAFAQTTVSSKGSANTAPVVVTPTEPNIPSVTSVRINEVESNADATDWVELMNTGTLAIDVSGWRIKDDKDSRTLAVPAGSVMAPGGYLAVDVDVETNPANFGLGAADTARLFLADGTTLIDSIAWTEHAATTLGRYPNGTGAFSVTSAATKGAANPVAAVTLPKVRINEVESSGDATDWIELKNTGATAVDLAGYVLKDNSDKDAYTFPASSTIASGGYLVVVPAFGLGGGDSARLFAPDATTLVDSYTWTEHATTTYGRCPDGTGDFTTTKAATKGAVNACASDLVTVPWPGAAAVSTVDVKGTYAENMSGLAYEAATNGNTLWAVQNNPGKLYRLTDNGTNWVSGSSDGWGTGKVLHFADGTGNVDAEGVVLTDAGAAGGVFVSTERDNNVSGTSRTSVLRYDVSSGATELTATTEWNLTADLKAYIPANGANLGLEAISWVPDSLLVSKGMRDESTGAAYNPAAYANHGTGLFFVGLEGGGVYAYALDQVSGGYHRVATISTGLDGVMELEFEAETGALWAVCDNTCEGRSAILEIGANGLFSTTAVIERPAGMPNLNNEGFAIAPQAQCVNGTKSVFWSDDSSTDGYALREGSIECAAVVEPDPTPEQPPVTPITPLPSSGTPTPGVANPGAVTPVDAATLTESTRGTVDAPSEARRGQTVTVKIGVAHAGETVNVWLHSTPVLLATTLVAADGTVRVVIPTDTPLGAHRVVVLAVDGTLIGWDNTTVTAATAGRLAATGTDVQAPVTAAMLLLLAGIAITLVRRIKPDRLIGPRRMAQGS